ACGGAGGRRDRRARRGSRAAHHCVRRRRRPTRRADRLCGATTLRPQAAAGGPGRRESAAQRDGKVAEEGTGAMGLRFSAICIDATDIRMLSAWWSQVLGWPAENTDDGDVTLRAPGGVGPDWLFLAVPEGKAVKNRIHFDFTPDDQDAEVERVIGLGGRRVDI